MNLDGIINKFSETLGGNIPGVLVTLFILVFGIIFAKILRRLFVSAFKKTKLNQKVVNSAINVNIAELGGLLIYFVIMLYVLLIVLERMNITSVLDPLKNLADQMIGTIPNLIGAGIVLYAGLFFAKIVKSIVEAVATRLDEVIAKNTLGINLKVSKPLGMFVFAIIFLPLAIQAIDMVHFDVIADPAKLILSQALDLILKIGIAGLVIVVTFFYSSQSTRFVSQYTD